MNKKFVLLIVIEMILFMFCTIALVEKDVKYLAGVDYYPYSESLTLCHAETINQNGEVYTLEEGYIIHPSAVSNTEVYFHFDGDYQRFKLPVSSFREVDSIIEFYNEEKSKDQRLLKETYRKDISIGVIASLVICIALYLVTKLRLSESARMAILITVVIGTGFLACFFVYWVLSFR